MNDDATLPKRRNERRFDRAARFSLTFALLILLTSMGQLVYRPTAG